MFGNQQIDPKTKNKLDNTLNMLKYVEYDERHA